MVQPINYLPQVRSPVESLLQGLQIGQVFQQNRLKQEAADRSIKLKEQYSADIQSAFNKGTPSAFAELTAKYPGQRDAFKQSYELLNSDQQNNEFLAGVEAFSAIKSGKVDVAKNLLNERITASENSGKDSTKLKSMLKGLDADPDFVANNIGLTLSSIDPEKWSKMTTSYTSMAKLPSDIANVESQIKDRANKYNLDVDTFVSEQQAKVAELTAKSIAGPELSANSEKLLNDNASKAVVAEGIAGRMHKLASTFEKLLPTAGVVGAKQESLAEMFGTQDAETELRKEYVRLRNASVMQQLPPGVASDKDIELAMSGYLTETANPVMIASFLRGMAKMNDVDAAAANASAEWISEVGNLGKSRQDMTINGVKIAKGSTFSDFSRKYVNKFALKQRAEADQVSVQNRGYMKYSQGQ